MIETLENQIKAKYPSYSLAQAQREAERCFYCYDPPCVKACPTAIDIPTFIKKIATNNIISAAKTILSANILGHSCAKVCPVEVLCAGACVYHELDQPPIAIGRLQGFATEHGQKNLSPEQILGQSKSLKNKHIALVGAGPASLAAASMLALEGYRTTIFEKSSLPGGLNSQGVAPYKLKHQEAIDEINWLLSLGIDLCLGVEISDYRALLDKYDAVFVGVGLGIDKSLDLAHIQGPGVSGACELIKKIKTDPGFSLGGIARAHIIGGGNTAIDCAHELKLLGLKEVSILYRRSKQHMSAYDHELALALASGVRLIEQIELAKIIREDNRLVGFTTNLSDEVITSDLIVLSIGQVGADAMPKHPKIWYAGDCLNGGKEVVNAVAEAKTAVADMIKTLERDG